jgi:hypothetical protein|tara:strand:+ start:2080 stop:2343 length:264 start_codon:yes stop_codon:yes gene_type:complete
MKQNHFLAFSFFAFFFLILLFILFLLVYIVDVIKHFSGIIAAISSIEYTVEGLPGVLIPSFNTFNAISSFDLSSNNLAETTMLLWGA